MSFREDLEEQETAEDFLTFLKVPFEPRVVHVNRLHILQRFHDYLSADVELEGVEDDEARAERTRAHLTRAYTDFVDSTAITEKVFKVHKDEAVKQAGRFVPLDSLTGVRGGK